MIGTMDSGNHKGEHDLQWDCERYPECRDVDPNHVGNEPYDDSDRDVYGRPYDPPPKHYEGDGIMPWAVVDAWGLDFYTGNVLKYICRAGKKDGAARLDDLRKAANYVAKAIEMEEKNAA